MIVEKMAFSNVRQYPKGWYYADRSYAAKVVTEAADRCKLDTPNNVQIDVDDISLTQSSVIIININDATFWDTDDPTDYTTPSNRAGKDFYVYLCHTTPLTSVPKTVISANATYPSGYTAENSRKIGGFHCLCGDVGVNVPETHPARGYLQGDIIPTSVWDLKFRCETESNEGLVWDAKGKRWVFAYFASGTGGNTCSVFGGTISDTRNWMDFTDDGHAIGMELPNDGKFQSFASGSNEETNIANSADPVTVGAWVDTVGRRMISDCFVEGACGVLWQWLSDQSTRWDFTTAWNYYDLPGAKGSLYNGAGTAGTGDIKLVAGGAWNDGSSCGSRSRYAGYSRWRTASHLGARFVARAIYR